MRSTAACARADLQYPKLPIGRNGCDELGECIAQE